jgi:biopolymer transport protein ExbD
MRKPLVLIAASMAAMFLLLMVYPAVFRHRPTGLRVKVALAAPCRTDLPLGESVRILRPGFVRLNSEEVTLDELDRRLEATFRSRAQWIVFVSGGADLPFRDVVAVIDVASKRGTYVALVTPAVEQDLKSHREKCLDPNIYFRQVLL